MALFKVYRGNEANLPSQMNDGWAYFCTDTCNFYIDWADDDQVVSRSQINAKSAETIRYMADGEYIELDVSAIAAFLNTDTTLSISGKAADAAAVGEVVADIRTEIDSKFSEKSNLYVQPDEPENASDGAIWVDTDESIAEGVIVPDGGNGNSSAVSVGDVTINLEDSNIGEANPIDANTLGGKTESELFVAKAVNADSLGGHTVENFTLKQDFTSLENKIPFSFGIDENGNYGYIKAGADSVVPFNLLLDTEVVYTNNKTIIVPDNIRAAIIGQVACYTNMSEVNFYHNDTLIETICFKQLEYDTTMLVALAIIPTVKTGDTITFPNDNVNWENHFVIWLK